MNTTKQRVVFCACILFAGVANGGGSTNRVTQYGIIWTFDKDYPVGQFINGDWWVVGPVQVTKVSPEAGPVVENDFAEVKSRYGARALRPDGRMRNGSMIIEGPDTRNGDRTGFNNQGYDSRVVNYSSPRSVEFPCLLEANRSLVSTISSENYEDGKLKTVDILGESRVLMCRVESPLALLSAAVLTCLDAPPPPDAFRPPYAGTEKPLYRAKDIQWDRLPAFPALESSPDWGTMERLFERPWLDHTSSWRIQYTQPGGNGPHYGREFARLSSLAVLMLLQDVPVEEKRLLLVRYLQLGIDLSGLAQVGRQWASDGGHWQGRKWPILFASLMLDDEALRAFPPIDLGHPVYGSVRVAASDEVKVPTTLFQEDMDYYYGQGGDGQGVLWQIVYHSGPQPSYQETPRSKITKKQKFSDGYHFNNVASGVGVALAAQLMEARAVWNHDAFFDYVDQWMADDEPCGPDWLPQGARRTYDPFVERMWEAYRGEVPDQPGGTDPVKWIWKSGATGCWISNPRKELN